MLVKVNWALAVFSLIDVGTGCLRGWRSTVDVGTCVCQGYEAYGGDSCLFLCFWDLENRPMGSPAQGVKVVVGRYARRPSLYSCY